MTDPADTPELSERVRRFVEAYAGVAAGNGVKACELAGYEGDRDVLATQAWRLLRKAEVKAAIEAMLESDPLVAGRVERLRFLTSVMRGEVTEPRVTGRTKDGDPIIEQCEPALRDRLAAQDALAKLGGDHVVKVANTNTAGEDLKSVPLAELLALASLGKTG